MVKSGRLYYDQYITEIMGYKIYTANHLPIEPEKVTKVLVSSLLLRAREEQDQYGVDALGENRADFRDIKCRVCWKEKAMTIIQCIGGI